jgi:hypothetical protein
MLHAEHRIVSSLCLRLDSAGNGSMSAGSSASSRRRRHGARVRRDRGQLSGARPSSRHGHDPSSGRLTSRSQRAASGERAGPPSAARALKSRYRT